MSEWIDISTADPPFDRDVLVYLTADTVQFVRNRIDVDTFRHPNVPGDRGQFNRYYTHNVTHWMPLPEAPE